ncbi:hypothetical protein ATU3C_09560 [Agrobacterium genomosp. 3 str. RTP8]|uniref:hypothetical protein n=1 Tax=Agrobacterium tomkonis TaxID=1183410 RepID=UPI001CD9B2A7|nr:hypothetical protein [Agrobacterium tomkonis RTP8]
MFAQLMREMLTPNTFESFRVYSLDTLARMKEALVLVDDVRRGRIPVATLHPIMDEIDWSLDKDPVARLLAESEIKSLKAVVAQKAKTNFPLDLFASHLKLIMKLVGATYKETVEQQIVESIGRQRDAINLRKLTGFYCSFLINAGYLRGHVLQTLNAYFFDNPVQRMGAAKVSKFFREFDCKQKKFLVYATVTQELSNYLMASNFIVHDNSRLTPAQSTALTRNPNFRQTPSFTQFETEQLDPHGAANEAYQSLSSHRAIAFLDPHGMHCDWGDRMYVTRPRAQSGISVGRNEFMLRFPAYNRSRMPRWRSIANHAKAINSSFDAPSTERLLSSINTAALATNSTNPENQLISLWSAFEVLLSDPRDVPRIVHYNELIAPCIAYRHARRQMAAVYNGLLVIYRRRFLDLIWRAEPSRTPDAANAFAKLIMLPEHEGLRTELCALIANNPLALHRTWKLHSDYGTPKKVHDALTDHLNRVTWQIHRIYRARNQLVHSGRTPTYLESVIINAAEYYRAATSAIVRSALKEGGKSDVDQIVAEIGIRNRIYHSKFDKRGNEPMTPDDVTLIMSPT